MSSCGAIRIIFPHTSAGISAISLPNRLAVARVGVFSNSSTAAFTFFICIGVIAVGDPGGEFDPDAVVDGTVDGVGVAVTVTGGVAVIVVANVVDIDVRGLSECRLMFGMFG